MTDWTIRFRFGGIESSLKYLEEMAAKGWMLEYWQENTLLFHRTEPKKLRFAMDIVPIGRWKLDGGRDNVKVREEFVAMYEEQGWHFITHHERKFLFFTEDGMIPMPQTDPVAYQDSVYRHHRNTTGGFGFLAIVTAAFLYYICYALHLYVTSPVGTGLLQLMVVLFLFSCFGVLHNGIPMMRERKILKRGQLPCVHGNEWWGRGMALWLVIAAFGTGWMSVMYMGKQAKIYLAMLICMVLMWVILNAGPLCFNLLGKIPLDQAKKQAYRMANVLRICGTVLLLINMDSDNQSIWMEWPQGAAPLVTFEEVYGEEVKYHKQTYQCGAAEKYFYSGDKQQQHISYCLVVSSWDAVHRAFERNPNIISYSFFPGMVDRKERWQQYLLELDAEQLGLIDAWQVIYPDQNYEYCPYKYYLETEEAVFFLEAEREISVEWIQEIARRLQYVKLQQED